MNRIDRLFAILLTLQHKRRVMVNNFPPRYRTARMISLVRCGEEGI